MSFHAHAIVDAHIMTATYLFIFNEIKVKFLLLSFTE